MTRILCILTTAVTALLVAGPGAAFHCNGTITTIDTGAATFYLDDRSGTAGDINHWTYMETNGVPDLQSGTDPGCKDCLPEYVFTDPCDHADPDTLII